MSEQDPVISDAVDRLIEDNVRTFMVTHRKDGSPTCHPMARFYAERGFYYNMYSTSVKHKNLTRDPSICVLITTPSDEPEFHASILRGTAHNLTIDETLGADVPPGVVLARGIGMEGVKKVEDAPEKFAHEEPEDWLKRAAIMVERIRDRVRVLWRVDPDSASMLADTRKS